MLSGNNKRCICVKKFIKKQPKITPNKIHSSKNLISGKNDPCSKFCIYLSPDEQKEIIEDLIIEDQMTVYKSKPKKILR